MEGSRGISKTFGNNTPFERTVTSSEGGFPLITFGDPNEMISVSQVDLGINACFARDIEEVRNERKRISIFLRNVVEATIIHTKTEVTILLFDEKDGSTVRGFGGTNETHREIFVNEFTKSLKLSLRKGVHSTQRRRLSVLEINLEVVRSMLGKFVGVRSAEDIGEVAIFFRNHIEVKGRVRIVNRRFLGSG